MNLKKEAAEYATKYVKDGQIVGLGTGTTSEFFIKKLGKMIHEEELDIIGIATSYQAFLTAKEANIPTATLEDYDVDVAVDGADAIDPNLNIIKGGGAAHTFEKIIDNSAGKFYVIADESKCVDSLTECAVPLEVIPMATRVILKTLEDMGAEPTLRISTNKESPVVSDNGNFIIDAKFDIIDNPARLETTFNLIPGIVENGLFTGMTNKVIIGTKSGIKEY